LPETAIFYVFSPVIISVTWQQNIMSGGDICTVFAFNDTLRINNQNMKSG